ncbi:hypothetical protein [Avibacterium paragallinarum]|uniref:DUF2975 domain-containing protein n=1 Tax=Avibacterium paragallinarum TaxID=728 RepID=A0ABU7QKF8_AVIPA|nr:hypothetical protein [Avibacterium paragallinarum]KAA6208111.1 hypothetical protein F1968_11130 [Avibacterium paragallinarum]QZP14734.1 hypothetical protein K5O18_07760 [Avibacterium paragallinarum]RZN68448.1 hypothetical protein EIG77_11140 [Avibacterium paragallinarum]WAL56636.1 hypothetical protein OY678_12005 [Avibacterium paragallinarum]WAM59172.1 hypothetical protein OW731_11805 [Avibacterium paragallinarum]
MQTKSKWIAVALITLSLSFILSYFLNQKDNMNDAIVQTIYTLSGIMFSIGMGIVCTFNPSSIKNKQVFKRIKNNITSVRNTFLIYFTISTITFLASQFFSRNVLLLDDLTFIFDPKILSLSFSIVSLIYFIINFLTIQKLIFDIAERVITEK